jgi:hypothetical protein
MLIFLQYEKVNILKNFWNKMEIMDVYVSDYPFGIFKLFLHERGWLVHLWQNNRYCESNILVFKKDHVSVGKARQFLLH